MSDSCKCVDVIKRELLGTVTEKLQLRYISAPNSCGYCTELEEKSVDVPEQQQAFQKGIRKFEGNHIDT